MKDVAKRCGVSESTVSHVINNTRLVSQETRERVLQAMRDLNYLKNAHARRLARGRSDFLGLIISDIENPFFPGLIKAFEASALERGFDVLLCATNYDPARMESVFRKMIENKVPGVAVMTSRVDLSLAGLLVENRVASVFLDSGTTAPLRSDIRLNYATGASQAINYLYNLGHRDCALIAGPQNRPSHVAYRKALETAASRVGLNLRVAEGENNVGSGERAVQRLLTESSVPTAILCSNDLTAIGTLRALGQAGIQVPKDVSVIGADDIPFALLVHPPLTTVRIPREGLGRLAFAVLEGMLHQDAPMGTESALDTELVIRESTATARAQGAPFALAGE
ncbi:MAG: LacI family DNA-binding transcriptional regulator [Acidobacteriota bacterium]